MTLIECRNLSREYRKGDNVIRPPSTAARCWR
jgi:hypothetical protein